MERSRNQKFLLIISIIQIIFAIIMIVGTMGFIAAGK